MSPIYMHEQLGLLVATKHANYKTGNGEGHNCNEMCVITSHIIILGKISQPSHNVREAHSSDPFGLKGNECLRRFRTEIILIDVSSDKMVHGGFLRPW